MYVCMPPLGFCLSLGASPPLPVLGCPSPHAAGVQHVPWGLLVAVGRAPGSRIPARTLGARGCRGPGPGQQDSSTYPGGSRLPRLPWAGPRAAGFQHVPWGLLVAVGRARAGVSGGRPGGRQQENLKAAAGGRQQQNTRFCDRWAGRRLLPKNDVFLLTKTAK